jgi:hypothetical protein
MKLRQTAPTTKRRLFYFCTVNAAARKRLDDFRIHWLPGPGGIHSGSRWRRHENSFVISNNNKITQFGIRPKNSQLDFSPHFQKHILTCFKLRFSPIKNPKWSDIISFSFNQVSLLCINTRFNKSVFNWTPILRMIFLLQIKVIIHCVKLHLHRRILPLKCQREWQWLYLPWPPWVTTTQVGLVPFAPHHSR